MNLKRVPLLLLILAAALALLAVSITLAQEGAAGEPDDSAPLIAVPQRLAALPVCEGFEAGTLPNNFKAFTTSSGVANGRVLITNTFAHSGTYGLNIDTDCNGCGGNTTQAAIMEVNLGGYSRAFLDFWVFEHGDENNPEDGVFISDDGGSIWAPALSLNNFPATYTQVSLDLAAAAASAGMSLVDGFQVKFQSLDNFSIPTDGYSFDDICVQPGQPSIILTKTVGLDPAVCATSHEIGILNPRNVTYCYQVTNNGNVTLTLHTLGDTDSGRVLSAFPYGLTPGSTVFVTRSAYISATTVNTATWVAYNLGGVEMAVGTDTAKVKLVQPAAYPVCTGFEGGELPDFFYPETNSSAGANGRVAVTANYPHGGQYALDIDTDCNGCGGNTLQAAIMSVDLARQNNPLLHFYVHEHGDENNPEDGIFISDDGGASWASIYSLNNLPGSYQNVNLDLAAAAGSAGMTLVDGFLIKFQSTDNFSIANDGYSFDDVCVEPHQPAIVLTKTVGLDPAVCASSSQLDIFAPTDVTYCYEALNVGNISLYRHDVDDTDLGAVVQGLFYGLDPGASVFITATAHIKQTTINTATWFAYNAGPADLTLWEDSATVSYIRNIYLPAVLKP